MRVNEACKLFFKYIYVELHTSEILINIFDCLPLQFWRFRKMLIMIWMIRIINHCVC